MEMGNWLVLTKCFLEQWEADASALCDPPNDVRFWAETSPVHQHERTDGGSHEGLQGTPLYERLDGSREGDL